MWGKYQWGAFMWGGVVCPSGITFIPDYSGDLAPGETLVIDFKHKTVTLDGVNVLKNFTSTFWNLLPGANTITYEDSEDSRTLLITITHRGKWI